MTIRMHRLVAAGIGLCAAPFAANELEQRRAVTTPSGWMLRSGQPLEPLEQAWRVHNSRWRLGDGTAWTSETAEQMYIRAALHPDAVLSLSLTTTPSDGLWIHVRPAAPATATRSGEAVACMGALKPPTETMPIELKKQRDSLLVRWGTSTMVCPDPNPPADGVTALKVSGADIDIQSIGRDRQRDGLPLAPIWWVASCILWMLPWMLIFDLLLSILSPSKTEPAPQPRPRHNREHLSGEE